MSNNPVGELGTRPERQLANYSELKLRTALGRVRAELERIKRVAESEASDERKVGAMYASADIAANMLKSIED